MGPKEVATELVLSSLFFFWSCFYCLVPILLSGNVGWWQCLCLSQFHAFLLLNNMYVLLTPYFLCPFMF